MASEQVVSEIQVTPSKYSKRVTLKTLLGHGDAAVGLIGRRVVIGGWVKSSREFRKEVPQPQPQPQPPPAVATDAVGPKDASCVEVLQSRIPFFRSIFKVLGGGDYGLREKLEAVVYKPPQPSISILQVNDGSCVPNLQVVVDSAIVPPSQLMPTGTCILAEGVLQKPSLPGKHVIEVKVEKILHLGTVDSDKYPLLRKRLPLESLRDFSHFRPRTTTVASVMRIRNALTQATHSFFQNNAFLFVQVPIITTTDSEGSREKFHVTTLLSKRKREAKTATEGVSLEAIKASIREKNKLVEELKRSDSNKEALVAAVQDLKKTNELVSQLEERHKAKPEISRANEINFSEDFFSRQTYLTVSGRLHLESYACSLGNVYSFGPRFRAEKSESKKSLAEVWMVELEMAFSQLEDAMDCADDFLKFLCKWVLDNCNEDLKFVAKRIDKTVIDRLQSMLSPTFERISYGQAIEVLKKEKKFQGRIEWGAALNEEHESFLADEIHKRPVVVYNHPKELKPLYARLNDDGRTVASFDVIVPEVGVVIRGSQQEERVNMLTARIEELGVDKKQYEWYLDLRRHGSPRHSGFSFAFDLLVLYATGLNDIRDVVPFPRSYGKANN